VALFEGFSPGMSLAKELLDRGDREVVLQYFERCRTLWPKGAGALARWKAMVEAGQTPDFPPALILSWRSQWGTAVSGKRGI
jgi:hypothetical protein